MKSTLKYLISNMLLVGLTGTMFLAAGCPSDEETSCTTDSECAEGETCNAETNVCEAKDTSCTDNSECTTEGELCLANADGSAKECRVPVDCSEQADPAAYCAGQIEGFDATTHTASCDDSKMCVSTEKVVTRFVQILDQSMGDSACKSTSGGKSDAGSDIFDLQLLDANGEQVGFAKTVVYAPGSGDPAYTQADVVFNGMPRDISFYDADNPVCPAGTADKPTDQFRDDTVVSLGCDGSLFVEFVDAAGAAIAIDSTHQILVAEFGGYCSDKVDPTNPGGDEVRFGSDVWSAYICETNATATEPTEADCGLLLSPQDGDQGFAIYDAKDVLDQQ